MAKTYNDVVTLMRRIIGENDGDDPDATDDLLLTFVADFLKLVMGQEIKSFDLFTFFEFSTVVGQEDYTFKGEGFTNLFPPIYVIDSNNSDTQMNYFQNPELFFDRNPVDNANQDNSRPNDFLFFNNEIKIRPAPDAVYTIKVRAYKEVTIPSLGGSLDGTQDIFQEYFFYYLAYGAALDYLAAFGQLEEYGQVEPIYKRYRNLVLMRKAQQATTQRSIPAL